MILSNGYPNHVIRDSAARVMAIFRQDAPSGDVSHIIRDVDLTTAKCRVADARHDSNHFITVVAVDLTLIVAK